MRLVGVTLLVVLALFVVAGCGGSSDTASEDTTALETEATEETTEETTSEETTEETTEDEMTQETTEETTSEDGDLATILGSEECASLVGLYAQFGTALGGANSDSEELDEAQKRFDELADKAPEEIQDDFAVIAEAWRTIADIYADIGLTAGETPDADAIAKLEEAGKELSEKIDSEEIEKASENISAWADENCNGNG